MYVLLVDNKSAHLMRLRELITEKLGPVQFNQKDPREISELDMKKADLVVISGGVGRSIVKNPRTFSRVVQLAEMLQKPTIGICLGAEAIAMKYGGILQEMSVRRVGNIPIYLDDHFAQDAGINSPAMVYQFHKWLISKNVPQPLKTLAISKDGVEILRHVTLPMWGLQFHPEVRRLDNAGHKVFAYILQDIGCVVQNTVYET